MLQKEKENFGHPVRFPEAGGALRVVFPAAGLLCGGVGRPQAGFLSVANDKVCDIITGNSKSGGMTGCPLQEREIHGMQSHEIALITDSCADLSADWAQRYPIYTIPYTITFSDGSFQDGVDLTAADVYRRQVTEMPKTSLPSGAVVLDTFRRIREDGYTRAIAVMLSSGLSGCYQMTRLMAQDCEDVEIAVFDSVSGSLGQGAIVLELARLIEEGRSWEQMLELTPRLIRQTHVFFSVDTLEYLQRGGRIGKITAMAGTALGIKPILAFDRQTGGLTSIHKVRGRAAAMKKLG